MRKIVAFMVVVTVIMSGFFYAPLKAQGDCNVPSAGYATIQAAANDAGCTTIHVAAGAHNEPLVNIDRSLTLVGMGASSTILNGRIDIHDTGPVNISGFTINNLLWETCGIFYDHSSGNATDNTINSYYGICYENGSGNVERNIVDSYVGIVYYPNLYDEPTGIVGNVRNNNIYADLAGVVYALASGTVEGNDVDAMVGIASLGSDVVVRNNPDIYAMAGVVYLLSKGSVEGNTIDAYIGVASALSCTLGNFSIESPYFFACTAGSVDVSGNEIESEAGIAYIASTGSVEGNDVEGDMLGVASVLSGLVEYFSYDEEGPQIQIEFSPGNVSIIENDVYGDEGLAGIFDAYSYGDIESNYVEDYEFGIMSLLLPSMNNRASDESILPQLLTLSAEDPSKTVFSTVEETLRSVEEALPIGGSFIMPDISIMESLPLTQNNKANLQLKVQQDDEEFEINIEGNTTVENGTGIEVLGIGLPLPFYFDSFPTTITRNFSADNDYHGIEAYIMLIASGKGYLTQERPEGASDILKSDFVSQEEGFPIIITDNVSIQNGLDGISFTWPFSGYIINNTTSYNTEDGIDVACFDSCTVMNNITTSNGTALGDGGIEVEAAPPIEDYNDVWGNFENYTGSAIAGAHDISQDPLFVSPPGDLHLICDSLAINAGDNAAPEIPVIDFDSESRIQAGIVDMGAFEGCAPSRRRAVYPSLLPTAVNHISEGKDLLSQTEKLIAQAKDEGRDTAQCEKLVEEAKALLEKAGGTLSVPIVANNNALAAIAKLKQAIECLKALLG